MSFYRRRQPRGWLVRLSVVSLFPADRHGLVHRSAAIKSGHSDSELGRACARGSLRRVVRGVFVEPAERDPEAVHRLLAIAVHSTSDGDAVVSHESAAVLHGMAMLKPDLRRAHLTARGASTNGRGASHRLVHAGPLRADEVATVDGIAVTSIERTAVDVACTGAGFARALAVFDAALRMGADREVIGRQLRIRRRGIGVARRAYECADPLAENPGESWARAQMIEGGVPVPRLQHEFRDRGRFVARADFDWEGLLVAEFDGAVKYKKHLRPGESPFDAMMREKRREDDLRRLGVMVIRFTWADLEAGRIAGMIREWLTRVA